MQYRSIFAVLFLCSLVAACDDNDVQEQLDNLSSSQHSVSSSMSTAQSSSSSVMTANYEGLWQSDSNGKVFSITSTGDTYTVSTYLFTSDYCLLSEVEHGFTNEDLETITDANANYTLLEIRVSDLLPGPLFEKKDNLPSACQENVRVSNQMDGYVFDPEYDFKFFWQFFDNYYFDFGLSETDWMLAYETYYPQAVLAKNEDALFEILSDMVTPLRDSHVFIDKTGSQGSTNETDNFFNTSFKPTILDRLKEEFIQQNQLTPPLNAPQQAALESYSDSRIDEIIETAYAPAASGSIKTALDNLLWYITEDNIGYLLIVSMSEFSDEQPVELTDFTLVSEAMLNIMDDLKETEGLIIDIRLNTGGFDLVSHAIAKHFFTDKTLVYRKQARLGDSRTPLRDVFIQPATTLNYTAPVALLTSHSTVSAAEVFTLIMRARDNVTIIGESTAGAFSDILEGNVTSQIAFGLSYEWYLTPNGVWLERQGIPADIEVPFPSPRGSDEALTTALDLLREH